MKMKHLGLLAIALLLIAIMTRFSTTGGGDRKPALLLPDLAEQTTMLSSVTLSKASGSESLVTLKKEDGIWLVEEMADYPADFRKLAGWVNSLAQATLVEKKTARPASHGVLGVASEGEATEVGTLVTLEFEGKDPVSVVIGKASESQSGSFVRQPSDDQVWLADREISVETKPGKWIDPVAINVDAAEIDQIEFGATATLIVARNQESRDFEIENLPDDVKLRYPGVVDSLARSLVNLRFEKVGRIHDSDWPDFNETRFLLGSGVRISAQTRHDSQTARYLLRFAVTLPEDASVPVSKIPFETATQWQFEVSEYVYNELNKSLTDLLAVDDEQDDEHDDEQSDL